MILIDFGRVSLSQKPFPTTEPDFEAKLKKIGKKIVNATKVPRTWFLAKNSRNLRFFYDFRREPYQNRKNKKCKTNVNATKVPRIVFLPKTREIYDFFYDFRREAYQNRKKKRNKIVNATKVPRIVFLAKITILVRFWPKPFQTHKKIVKKYPNP